MVKFRQVPFTAENMKELRQLQKLCLPYDSPYRDKKAWYWIGYWKDVPVAFCVLAPSVRWSDCVYMARSGVIPAFRGKGLQKRMIVIRERWARRKGYKWSVTDTSENPPSANSLISRGYRIYEPTVTWGLATAIYWRKRL